MTRTEKYRKLREELCSSSEREWMKKMKPKTVLYVEECEMGVSREKYLECSSCFETNESDEWNYCPFCGQSIKMTEE